jgi:hypothetical protein
MLPIFRIGPSVTLSDLEQCLTALPAAGDRREAAQLRIEIGPETDLLTDIWCAILCGTLCRRADTDIVYSETGEDGARFSTSLAGLVAASIASSIRNGEGVAFDASALRHYLSVASECLVTPDSDTIQTLVEFDARSGASSLFERGNGTKADRLLRRQLFETQILQFRQLLDLGAPRRGSGPVRDGFAGDLGNFLAELYENGLEHGSLGVDGPMAGTRTLRLRTHSAGNPGELIERCGPFRQLRHYVQQSFRGKDPVSLLEASVSDFGLGIVDAFQTSPAGMGADVDRRALLEGLIYGRLSSKSNDSSAGLGIQDALDAARRMQAFVSLRTAEFWMAVSFLSHKPDARLVHLGRAEHPRVEGTHWQLFWPHG